MWPDPIATVVSMGDDPDPCLGAPAAGQRGRGAPKETA